MSQVEYSSRFMYLKTLRKLLQKKGIYIDEGNLSDFSKFIQVISPWLPENGTLDEANWERIGRDMKLWLINHRDYSDNQIPENAITYWYIVKQALTRAEITDLPDESENDFRGYDEPSPLLNKTKLKKFAKKHPTPKRIADLADLQEQSDSSSSDCEKLSPENEFTVEERAARYNEPDRSSNYSRLRLKEAKSEAVPRRSCLHAAMKEARRQGDPFFSFPIIYDKEDEPDWEPVSFKILKDLKEGSTNYGPTAPYVLSLLETLSGSHLTPSDWQTVARSCLSGGQFLMWKINYEDEVKKLLSEKDVKADEYELQGFPVYMGIGRWASLDRQLQIPRNILREISSCALRAWRTLPSSENRVTPWSEIRQSPTEPYADFIARLTDVVTKTVANTTAADLVIKQLAYENANKTCQALLKTHTRDATIGDYIRLCADLSPSVAQGLAIAAALQGNFPGGVCFSCGNPGHFRRDCPQGKGVFSTPRPPQLQSARGAPATLCPRCGKGYHWKRDCISKFHKNGTPLRPQQQMQGNHLRAQSRAPQIMGTSLTNSFRPELLQTQLSASSEPHQGAQDWTCVPPPQS